MNCSYNTALIIIGIGLIALSLGQYLQSSQIDKLQLELHLLKQELRDHEREHRKTYIQCANGFWVSHRSECPDLRLEDIEKNNL